MLHTVLFAGALIAVSMVLVRQHRRVWRAFREGGPGSEELDFAGRQYRRRMQASLMVSGVALLLVAGNWIQNPVWQVVYWSLVMIVVLWIGLLALADAASTREFFHRISQAQLTEQAKLHSELTRLERAAGDLGDTDGGPQGGEGD